MKRILSFFVIFIMLAGFVQSDMTVVEAASGINVSTRGTDSYGTSVELNGETVKKFVVGTNNYSNVLNEDASNGKKISDAIVDFEIMLAPPVSTGTPYVFFILSTGKEDGSGTLKDYYMFQMWNSGLREREGIADALGIATTNAHLVDQTKGSTDDSFAITYNTWNRIRFVFSSTTNTIKVYHKDSVKTYTFADGASMENNVWKFRLDFRCTGGITGDAMYIKNMKSFYTFADASESDRLTIANETGDYAYSYDDNSGVFDYSTNYSYGNNTAEASVTGFKDADSDVDGWQLPDESEFTIPAYIDGYPVKTIGAYAFSKDDLNKNVSTDTDAEDGRYINIQKINMPETLTTISTGAFHGMHGLKKVVLPENLTTIGDYAFRNAFNVDEFVFNDKLKSIGKQAFYKLGNMNTDFNGTLKKDASHKVRRMDIPASVTSIGEQAFNNTQVDTIIFRGNISTSRAMFIWLNSNHLVFMGNVTTDGKNPFAHYSNDSNVTTWRSKKVYCSDSVNQIIQPLIEAVDSQPGYTYSGHSTAWIDTTLNKAYVIDGNAIAFTASYDDENSLVSVSESVDLSSGESADFASDPEAVVTKLFVWSDFENAIPKVKCETLTSEIDLFLISDSICQEYDSSWYPRQGWGSYFTNNTSDYFDENLVTVHNHAKAGWSTNHFLKQYTAGASDSEEETLMTLLENNPDHVWENILPSIGAGDYVLVALGINDNSSSNLGRNTEDVYKANLKKLAEDTRAKGAEIIFMTPSPQATPLRNSASKFTNAWSARGNMVKAVAAEIGAVCLDHGTEATAYFNSVAEKYNQNIPEGADETYGYIKAAGEFYLSREALLTSVSEGGWGMSEAQIESGSLGDIKSSGKGYDDTHTSEKGAKANAEIICRLIKSSDSGLKNYCK